MTRRHARTVLGIGISEDSVRAVLWQRDAVAWTHEAPVHDLDDLRDAVRTVLSMVPRPRYGKHPVAVAIGPNRAQLKRLRNLPAVKDRRALDAIVQESAGRYFRQNGTPMRTTGVAVDAPGEGWAGAIEAPLVQMVTDTCWDAGHHDVVIIPTAAVLRAHGSEGSVTWRDGNVVLQLRHEADALVDCRCTPVSAAMETLPSLHSHADGASDFASGALTHADALGAARSGFSSPLALRVDPSRQRVSTGRMIGAGVLCSCSLLLLLLAPGIRASREERTALLTLAALSAPAAVANIAEAQLSERARTLSELVRFQRGAPSTLLLLASLTHHIKAPSTIVSLRLDSDWGTLAALTPSASALVATLREVPEIRSPTIVGAVTPESQLQGFPSPLVGSAASLPPALVLQRVTIRFHWEGERLPQKPTGRE